MNKFGVWTKPEDELPPEPLKIYGGKDYLCTVINDQVVPLRYTKTKVRDKEVIRWEYCGKISPWKVIAWMPFPEAFKEQ